jgi:hypothetical protein
MGEPGAYIPQDDNEEKDDKEASTHFNVVAKIGAYSFNIGKEDYIGLINGIRVSNGFDDKLIIEELKRRLKRK